MFVRLCVEAALITLVLEGFHFVATLFEVNGVLFAREFSFAPEVKQSYMFKNEIDEGVVRRPRRRFLFTVHSFPRSRQKEEVPST